MFYCKKVRHIAYYVGSVYLVVFGMRWVYEVRKIVDKLSGPKLSTYLHAAEFVLMSHCQDMFSQV
jgi:hypothetical protein